MINNLTCNNLLKKKDYIIFCNFYKIIKNTSFYTDGYAIASKQIGIRKNLFSLYYKSFFFFKNCFYIWKSNEKIIYKEGCLSFNDIKTKIRSKYIAVFCENKYLNRSKVFVKNFTSICLQHETDHLCL
ncbi:peptide deformylase [Candidatus Vidania fulgoroideorum]